MPRIGAAGGKDHHGFRAGEKQLVTWTAREEFHLRIGLSIVVLEE
jgi:hypothetical protein